LRVDAAKIRGFHLDPEFVVDLESMTVKAGGLTVKVSLPDSRRKALMEGTWDSTGILQANADKVAALVGRLPYIKNFA
jgi:3-isopropylmalate/(R)-2-methylmalate dehydratase small subunit